MTELHRHTSAVDELREGNRPSPLFTHLSAVSEGIVALGWIVEKRPGDFVTDTLGGAQYYGNKVLKEYKEKYGFRPSHFAVELTGVGTRRMLNTFRLTTRSSGLWLHTSRNTLLRA